MIDLLFFCKAPMNAVMFERPLRRIWDDPRLRIQVTGQGRVDQAAGGGSATEILTARGFPGVRQAHGFSVRWKRWDALITPDMMQPTHRARRTIQIFHGISFKGKMFTPKIQTFSDLFLIGEDMRRRFIDRGLFPEDSPALHRVGFPKLDPLYDGSLDRTEILRQVGADPQLPALLYAPTWRPESSLYREGVEFMQRCATQEGWTLLVKLHDWAWDPATNPINWRQKMPELEGPQVRFVRQADIVPYLFAADALVSDASSVANEYLALDRPIIWIDVPELIERYARTIDLDGWGRQTGPVVRGVDELMEACVDALARPMEMSEIRRRAAADFFYNPGRATEVFLETLSGLLGLDLAEMNPSQ